MENNVLDVGLTMTFKEIFEDSDTFIAEFKTTPFYRTPVSTILNDSTLELVFILLYNRYGNNQIVNNSLNQFKSKLFGILWAVGPIWNQKLKIQEKLWSLGLEDNSDIYKGSTAIYNHAQHPETEPGTGTDEELTYINNQDVTKYKKSKLEGLMLLADTLNDRITEDFVLKFRKLFKTFVLNETVPTFITEN